MQYNAPVTSPYSDGNNWWYYPNGFWLRLQIWVEYIDHLNIYVHRQIPKLFARMELLQAA